MDWGKWGKTAHRHHTIFDTNSSWLSLFRSEWTQGKTFCVHTSIKRPEWATRGLQGTVIIESISFSHKWQQLSRDVRYHMIYHITPGPRVPAWSWPSFLFYHATAKMLKIGTKERDPVIEMFPSSKPQQYYKVRVCRKKQWADWFSTVLLRS